MSQHYRTGTPMVEAGNRLAFRRTSEHTPMSFNQSHGHSLANLATRRRELNELLAVVAAEYLNTVPDLTPAEKQLLWDLRRPGSERGTRVFTKLLDIAPRAANPHLFDEVLRGQILARLPRRPLCYTDLLYSQTRLQHAADLAQWGFALEKTSTRRDQMIETTVQEADANRALLDFAHQWSAK